jgi:peptide/nickel transport system permease protein
MMKQFSRFQHLTVTILIVLHVTVLLAGFLSPYDPAMQNRTSPLLSPTSVHFVDKLGVFRLRPVVRSAGGTRDYPLHFLVPGSTYQFLGLWTAHTHLFGLAEPGRLFLFGTDEFGRDQFSRILWGGQISLLIGWLATSLALGIGLALGSVAGFFGGWADAVIMRGAELFLALPWLYLLLAIRAFLPLSLPTHATALMLTVIIGAVGWARPARLVRGIVLSARERDFVYAARGFGASSWHLLRRHCLPETYTVLATQATLLIPQFILAEVALSFIGLGVGEPAPSWGNLLTPLRQMTVLTSSWWMIIPALVIMMTSWCFLSLGDVIGHGEA